MTDKLHDLRLRQLPNGGFVLTNAGTQPGWMEYEIGAYGNASEAHDAICGIISPKPEEMESQPGTRLSAGFVELGSPAAFEQWNAARGAGK